MRANTPKVWVTWGGGKKNYSIPPAGNRLRAIMKNISIAPGHTIGDWQALDLSDKRYSPAWEKAIGILEARIRGRFIEPVNQLLACEKDISPKERKYGFSIMAILCLLVESLQSFFEGKGNTQGISKSVFTRFFTENEPFKSRYKVTPDLAVHLYYHLRCGILHQAEVTGGSRLRSIGPTFRMTNGKLIINRTKFANAVFQIFDDYLKNLKADTPEGVALRINLEKKFTQIIANCS
jgi:hypothetical protein